MSKLRFSSDVDFTAPRGIPEGVTAVLGSVDAPERALLASLVANEALCGRAVLLLAFGREPADHEALLRRLAPDCMRNLVIVDCLKAEMVESDVSEFLRRGCALVDELEGELGEVTLVVDDVGSWGDWFGEKVGCELLGGLSCLLGNNLSGSSGLRWSRLLVSGCGDILPADGPTSASYNSRLVAEASSAAVRDLALRGKGLSALAESASAASMRAQALSIPGGPGPAGGVISHLRSIATCILSMKPLPSGRSREVAGVVYVTFQPHFTAAFRHHPPDTHAFLRVAEGSVHLAPDLA